MLQPRARIGFQEQSLADAWSKHVGQDFQRRHPTQREVLRAVNHAHATGAQQRLHTVVRNDAAVELSSGLIVSGGSTSVTAGRLDQREDGREDR